VYSGASNDPTFSTAVVCREQSILHEIIIGRTVNVPSYCASFENVGTWAWGLTFQSSDTTAGRPSRKAEESVIVCRPCHYCVPFIRVPAVIGGLVVWRL